MGELAEAGKCFEAAVANHKDQAQLEGQKGFVVASRSKTAGATRKKLQDAIAHYSRALELGAPEQDEVLGSRAECYASTGVPGDLARGKPPSPSSPPSPRSAAAARRLPRLRERAEIFFTLMPTA